jgi:hypothetical protein
MKVHYSNLQTWNRACDPVTLCMLRGLSYPSLNYDGIFRQKKRLPNPEVQLPGLASFNLF